MTPRSAPRRRYNSRHGGGVSAKTKRKVESNTRKNLHTNGRRLWALALSVLLGVLLPVSIGAQPATGETATGETAAVLPATGESGTRPSAASRQAAGAALLASDAVLTDAVSPVGTTINLFDYWITTQNAPDTTNPPDMDQGINQGKLLQFTAAAPRNPNGGINDYTGSAKPRTGIVQDLLQNNYPILSQGNQSLNYLFNPNQANPGKASYPNVRDLLQIDDQGYYYYDSALNFAQYDQGTNAFILYDSPGVLSGGSSGQAGQFFPFNVYSQVKNLRSNNAALNHYFGVTMTTRFVQQPNGTVDGTAGGTPVTYEFTGDDDVWVFIDNVLVGDLGGIHDAASLKIDFQNGQVFINGNPDGTIRDKFLAAGVPWTNTGSDTFADDTYHTLKFFYLERGNYDSNMKLKFNLVSIPQSDLIKVDQIGDPVPGAEFRLYYANDDYSYDPQNLIATGTTGANGYFVFQNPDGTLLSLNNLKNEYGGPGQTGKFVLVESVTPEGYRSPPQIDLYFPQGYDELATLLSANPWDTGAYASPVVTSTLPDSPEGLDGTTYSADDGTYFAVVLKRQDAAGSGSSTESQWYPVSGDPITGWTVQDGTSLQDVLTAARANPYLFTLDSSGAYQTTIDNLPGDILTYYYVLATNGKLSGDNAQYTVGFYRTSAPNLAGATPQNTVRLNDDLTSQYGSFQREFSVRLFVPDIKNYFFVQKVGDDNAAPLDGAVFGLYLASDVTDGQVNPGAQPYDTVTTEDLSQDRGRHHHPARGGDLPQHQDGPARRHLLPEGTQRPGRLRSLRPAHPGGGGQHRHLCRRRHPHRRCDGAAGCGQGGAQHAAVCGARRHQCHPHRHQGGPVHRQYLHPGHRRRLGGVDAFLRSASGSFLLQQQPDPGIRPHHPRGPGVFPRQRGVVPAEDHPELRRRHRPGPENRPGQPGYQQPVFPQYHCALPQRPHPAHRDQDGDRLPGGDGTGLCLHPDPDRPRRYPPDRRVWRPDF